MSINLTNLFTELGEIGGILNSVNTYRGTTIPARISTMYGTFEANGIESVIDGFVSTQTGWQSSCGGINSQLKALAQATVIKVANNDALQPDSTLKTALAYLIAQMTAQSATVKASVVGITGTASGGNDGNPSFVYSTLTSGGSALENLLAETMTGSVTSDSQTGGVSAGSEVITFTGQQAQSDSLSYLWPQGSGSSLSLTVVNAANNEPGGYDQWLTNGDFETWTISNVPDGFHITVGTAGTQVLRGSSAYTGSYSLGLVGDGTTLTAVQQQFGLDNTNSLSPITQYAVNLWVKASSVPASGVLEIALVDGTGAITSDSQGNRNVFTKSLNTLTTSFVAIGGTFRTPKLLPSSAYLRVRFSTACPAGSTIYVDRLSFTQMRQFYTGGPYIAGFSGNSELIYGDSFTVTTTNTAGGFQRLSDRLFGMRQLQMLLPSSATPTISDSLIA